MIESPSADLLTEVERVQWYHTMSLGGVQTRGSDPTPSQLPRLHLPEQMHGMSVLDVGAWDGFYSFEAERRGAQRVLATDYQAWRSQEVFGWGTGKSGFELARRTLGSRVEDLEIDVHEISPQTVGMFDIVLFLGVLYHLPDPFTVLQRVASVTKRLLIVETATDMLWMTKPALAFYPGTELNKDGTNWFAPNIACVDGMLRACGFPIVECASKHEMRERLSNAVIQKMRGKEAFFVQLRRGRAVFHARRDSTS